jgi:hypothetical protein
VQSVSRPTVIGLSRRPTGPCQTGPPTLPESIDLIGTQFDVTPPPRFEVSSGCPLTPSSFAGARVPAPRRATASPTQCSGRGKLVPCRRTRPKWGRDDSFKKVLDAANPGSESVPFREDKEAGRRVYNHHDPPPARSGVCRPSRRRLADRVLSGRSHLARSDPHPRDARLPPGIIVITPTQGPRRHYQLPDQGGQRGRVDFTNLHRFTI